MYGRFPIPFVVAFVYLLVPHGVFASTIPMAVQSYFPTLYPIGPYGSSKTALRTDDVFDLSLLVLARPSLTVTADLSELGLPDVVTTTSQGPYYAAINGTSYSNVYSYRIGPLTLLALSDGVKNVIIRGSDLYGNNGLATTTIVVDNTAPTISLSDITFSTTSPKKGDLMYLSGSASGTGSALAVREIRETLWDAQNKPIWGSSGGINYAATALTSVIASSIDGTFTNVPFVLNDSPAGDLVRAVTLKIAIITYDGAGNTATTSLSVPIPRPDPCIATNSCASNVLFLPGIESSRLYRPDYIGGTDRLWEPNTDSDVQDLYMNPDGSSIRYDVYTKERDVLDELPGGKNIYKSFISKMDVLKTDGIINAWEPIAYDWRLSLDDILAYGNDVQGRIYYSGDLRATSTPYIIQQLKHLASTSKTGKVTIVAHSNGGLLAKRLTQVLGESEASRLIDKMILVAAPQAGTPMAIPAGLHGYEQDHLFGLVTSKSTARTFAVNAPMEYQLLPSAQYFTQVDDPVVSFDASLPDWISRYGATIHSQETLHTFLTDTYGRVNPQTGDIDQPIQMNNSLLTGAEALHNTLDTWIPPAGISLVQIAGWGVPKTVSGIAYKKKDTGVISEPILTVDGDGTVVSPSALWASVTAGAQNYWLDLNDYNRDHPFESGLGFASFNHSRILEVNQLLDFISNEIKRITQPLSDYTYLFSEAPPSVDTRLRYTLHSPLTLNLYDDQGRHTGVSTTTWQIEEQIPGTYYAEFGDVKYLFSDASSSARILMDGYAPGTFTFNIDQYSGDTLTASTTFKDIPTTSNTIVQMDVQSDISTLSPMSIDKNGDGIVDVTIAPRLGDIVTFDTTPPELQLIFSTSTNLIEITAQDAVSTTSVETSTIYPVLSKKQKHGVATTTFIARDASGNSTSLVYTKPSPSDKQTDEIDLLSLEYNGATTTLYSTKVLYKWDANKKELYRTFKSDLSTSLETISSTYNSRKDSTTILPLGQILPGMVIPYMKIKEGSLIINY